LNIETPWGAPSSPVSILHTPSGAPVAFIARHGVHHNLTPSEVPARANIAALRSIGVRTIIAFSAVGSLREEIKPRDFVIPTQIIDRTKGIRPATFFQGGVVAHVGFADPFDDDLAKVIKKCERVLQGEQVVIHMDKTLICMGMCAPFNPPPLLFSHIKPIRFFLVPPSSTPDALHHVE